jgi:hypothetical protein
LDDYINESSTAKNINIGTLALVSGRASRQASLSAVPLMNGLNGRGQSIEMVKRAENLVILHRQVSLQGVPFTLTDMAGLPFIGIETRRNPHRHHKDQN